MVGIGTSTGTRSLFARPDSLTRALRSFAREDLTAYETMKKSTEKYHNGTVISCQKPCTSGYLKDLCCDDVFSVGVAFSNAAEKPDIVTSTLYVGEYGRVFQGLQISGTFFQDFKLRNYPFGASMLSMLSSSMSSSMLTSVSADSLARSLAALSGSLEAAISLRLTTQLYDEPEAATILPIPVAAKYLMSNNGNSAGNGWYLSNVSLAGNRPDFVRGLSEYEFSNPLNESENMNFRGALVTKEQLDLARDRLGGFLTLLDAFTPTLDMRFILYVGSVDAFITTLPLALLALLNLAVFLTVGAAARTRPRSPRLPETEAHTHSRFARFVTLLIRSTAAVRPTQSHLQLDLALLHDDDDARDAELWRDERAERHPASGGDHFLDAGVHDLQHHHLEQLVPVQGGEGRAPQRLAPRDWAVGV